MRGAAAVATAGKADRSGTVADTPHRSMERMAVTLAHTTWNDLTFAIPPTGLLLGSGATVVIRALLGLSPAARAARLAPADAIRPA